MMGGGEFGIGGGGERNSSTVCGTGGVDIVVVVVVASDAIFGVVGAVADGFGGAGDDGGRLNHSKSTLAQTPFKI
jgi:hypothetical protein